MRLVATRVAWFVCVSANHERGPSSEMDMDWVHPWVGLGWVAFSSTCDGFGWVGLNEKYCYFFTAFCVCYNIMCKENLQITRVMRTQCTDRVHAIVILQKKAGLVLGSNLVYSRWEFSLHSTLVLQIDILFPLFL